MEQGRRYGLFVIFFIFLIRGTVGTPTSSSGTSGHFDDVLDAGAPRHRLARAATRRSASSRVQAPDTHSSHTAG